MNGPRIQLIKHKKTKSDNVLHGIGFFSYVLSRVFTPKNNDNNHFKNTAV